jgi:mannose-6-phosphate isomerase-like protein (cupin superfamily)
MLVEHIEHEGATLAIIVSRTFAEDGIHFFTPDDFSQQLGFLKHPRGKVIEPHVHNAVAREVHFTNEVLFIRKGKLRVDFYDDRQQYLKSRLLEAGDVILLVSSGHGFEAMEEVEMFEVKQGPFAGDRDKTRFTCGKVQINYDR